MALRTCSEPQRWAVPVACGPGHPRHALALPLSCGDGVGRGPDDLLILHPETISVWVVTFIHLGLADGGCWMTPWAKRKS